MVPQKFVAPSFPRRNIVLTRASKSFGAFPRKKWNRSCGLKCHHVVGRIGKCVHSQKAVIKWITTGLLLIQNNQAVKRAIGNSVGRRDHNYHKSKHHWEPLVDDVGQKETAVMKLRMAETAPKQRTINNEQ